VALLRVYVLLIDARRKNADAFLMRVIIAVIVRCGRQRERPQFGETVEGRRTLHRRLYLTRGRLEFSLEIRSPEKLHAAGPMIPKSR